MSITLLQGFPDFNVYSMPLLVLVSQGLIFAFLLFAKYKLKRSISYLFLGLILLITCYHRTTYTIGFMAWYDTFPNTKINYYLVSLGLVVAPLIYFYVKSITVVDFRFKRKDILHFIPAIIFVALKLFILIYDASQPGFEDSQNGYMVENFQWKYIDPIFSFLNIAQMLLYLAFSFQLYYLYRRNIMHFFSNTYTLELNWLRNFLWAYSLLFLYDVIQILISVANIADLSWTQKWWQHFFSALVVIYLGVKGYFTNTLRLTSLNFGALESPIAASLKREPQEEATLGLEMREKMNALTAYMNTETPYLSPELNLIELSRKLNYSRAELSELINVDFGQNFNDFVNTYRVNAFKGMLEANKHQQLSLLGIALDCGFNSKATFNRVFKKNTGYSPSEYLKKNMQHT